MSKFEDPIEQAVKGLKSTDEQTGKPWWLVILAALTTISLVGLIAKDLYTAFIR